MTLESWLENKWLKRHKTSPDEIKHIFKMVERDFREASNESISLDWRMGIAFNAALLCATASLCAAGFRPSGEGHHERIINSLKYTIGASDDLIKQLNRFRNKRIKVTYDMAGTTTEQEVEEAVALAHHICDEVKNRLRQNHPELYG